MIRGYSDHAANERTFLAWVRNAVAVIAFGFVMRSSTYLCSHWQMRTRLLRNADCSSKGSRARSVATTGSP
jgi:Domain of unknown function (DUF202)